MPTPTPPNLDVSSLSASPSAGDLDFGNENENENENRRKNERREYRSTVRYIYSVNPFQSTTANPPLLSQPVSTLKPNRLHLLL